MPFRQPHELKALVVESERAWQALGGVRYGPEAEQKVWCSAGRSAAADIAAGDLFTEDNIRIVRPGDGAYSSSCWAARRVVPSAAALRSALINCYDGPRSHAPAPIAIVDRLELMVDRAMVASRRGLRHRAVTPRSEEVVFRFARPGAPSVAISPPSTAVSSVNSNFTTAVIVIGAGRFNPSSRLCGCVVRRIWYL